MKTQKLTLFLALLFAYTLGALIFPGVGSKVFAATCYTDRGGISVGPATISCPPASTNPAVSYINLSGTSIPGPEEGDHCYAGTTTATFSATTTYREKDCSDLELLRNATLRELCTASGGSWQTVTERGQTDNYCECPAGKTLSSTSFQCSATATNESGGATQSDLTIREKRKEDCITQNNSDLDGNNCGIVGVLNTVFNLVSGLIGIAVIGNIIYGGILYSMAQGDPGNAQKAKNRIRDAVIAFIMYLSLYGFLQWLIPGGVF